MLSINRAASEATNSVNATEAGVGRWPCVVVIAIVTEGDEKSRSMTPRSQRLDASSSNAVGNEQSKFEPSNADNMVRIESE